MEYFPGILPLGDRKISSSLVFDEFVPPSAWTEDQTCHYLLVDLPGFKKHELKLQVDNQTRIVVSGERQVNENKYKRFEQKFDLPNNADIEKITGKLDSEILYISVPKKVQQEIKHHGETGPFDPAPAQAPAPTPSPHPVSEVDEDENKDDDNNDDDDEKSDAYENADESETELERKKGHESNSDEDRRNEVELFLRIAIEKLKRNKGIVMTAIFAFSLGVLVTHKFQSNEH